MLKVPEITTAKEAVDCPVCKTPRALTLDRIKAIRTKVEANAELRSKRQSAESALRSINETVTRVVREANGALPQAAQWNDQDRSRNEAVMRELLGQRTDELMSPWRETLSNLDVALGELNARATAFKDTVESLRLDDLDEAKIKELNQKVTDLFQSAHQVSNTLRHYRAAAGPLLAALKEKVDRQAGTEGWQDLIELVEQREDLLRWLIARAAHRKVLAEVEDAIRDIDRAKAEILDDKFAELSQESVRWWNLLRPHEPVSFRGIERGGAGTRYIDLKARLRDPRAPESQGVLRDAVAVFSDSQLNCLGLAAFLARTIREGARFLVLDDPVPASDKEHRAFFIDRVLDELIQSGIQVILLSHDERMWKDVQERYKHLDLDTFIVSLDDPAKGAIIENRNDTLDAMLTRAALYVSNANPDIRKTAARILRDAAERFCKLMFIMDRREKGDSSASVSDYDGKTLGELIPKVQPLLTKDSSHPGKLRVIGQRLNPGSHDHEVPPVGDLGQCLGDLKALRREYLP